MTDLDPTLVAGAVLSDRYRLQEELGRGGTGRVFRAHDDRLDRPVAVKVLTDLGDEAMARFRREAATAARIRHPNVVTLHDAGVDGTPYLVMSLVEGASLADRVQSDGPLSTAALHRLATDLFAGLEATHEAGVLHRDLTPRNVLFDRDGTALLADFGIARGADDATVTAEHTVMGTRPFVAPERLRGQDATVASDVYAVGVTLQYAVTGGDLAPLPDEHPFAPLVAACTAGDPHQRPTSIAEAGRHLETLAPDPPGAPTRTLPAADATTEIRRERAPASPTRTATSPPVGDPRPTPRRPLLVLGMLVALAVVALVGSAAVRRQPPVDPAVGSTGAESTNPPGQRPAPDFDPTAPGDSARQLAEWLRNQEG